MGESDYPRQQKMNIVAPAFAADGDLWGFSLAFYRNPGVAESLIALQDEAGLDVNLLLFALWLGLSGRGRLDAGRLNDARRAVRSLSIAVIAPLRDLRRRLKSYPDADIQSLRERIKALEIEAEQVAQNRLARLAGQVTAAASLRRLADAESNLDIVLGPAASTQPAADLRGRLRDFARVTVSPQATARPSA
jgi:uncharacterized protein (TIGR02444 family)